MLDIQGGYVLLYTNNEGRGKSKAEKKTHSINKSLTLQGKFAILFKQ